jgi:Ser-tRNA(Ala) deacylase AlaX
MTRKRFWTEPYLTAFDARVTSVNGPDVTVDETIFYAESGGQQSDAGTIGGVAVARAEKRQSDIVYTLAAPHTLAPGQGVRIEIDWTRRHRLMRLHLAAELVLELVYRRLAGVEKVGAHISPEKARIDFSWPESIAAMLPALAADASALVAADHPIVSAFSDEQNERRYWEIAGFARVPCGGTHLRRTGEIGAIALKRDNRGKGQQRIVITVAG